MTPSHSFHVSDEREAYAPYNFVPLPERVVPTELIDQRDYHPQRHTGQITCTLTTESPMFVRCGLTPAQLAAGIDAKDRPEFFFTDTPDTPVLPGSSLRGMLRALVEIAAYAKPARITDRSRFFYRAVAAKSDDPLAGPYRAQLRNVKAGYLTRRGEGWAILPTRPVNGESFIKVRERDIPASVGLIRMTDSKYHLQQIAVSFTEKRTPGGRTVVDRIDRPGVHPAAGMLVTSGNMIETGQGRKSTPRKNHVVMPEAVSSDQALPIATQALDDYRNGLSDFILEQLGSAGVLVEGGPVFYCEPGRGEREVTAFGHSQNFRLPYRFPGSERAATPLDFVPEELREDEIIDLAEAIFGFVRSERQANQREQAVAGRVFVSDGLLVADQAEIWYGEHPLTPQILGSPKPTTFQHYLVQPRVAKRELKHFGSRPGDETVIRGHKLYWHKGATTNLALAPEKLRQVNETQTTTIRPVRAGVRFNFTLHFENLSDVELGALLWVLQLGRDPAYRLKLGMGKPLGMGAVCLDYQITQSHRELRYTKLFDEQTWNIAERNVSDAQQQDAVRAFEDYVLEHSGERARGYTQLRETLRMRCLLALLGWPGPLPETTRYLEIERGSGKLNEYKERPVLPLPTQVAGLVLTEADQARIPTQRGETPRREEPARPAPRTPVVVKPSLPEVGATFTGKVLNGDADVFVIQVPGFTEQEAVAVLKIEPGVPKFRIGKDNAKVEVVAIRQTKSGKTILEVRRPQVG